MTCNMMDIDGNPGGDFPGLPNGWSRVVGVLYAQSPLDTIFADGFESGDTSIWQ